MSNFCRFSCKGFRVSLLIVFALAALVFAPMVGAAGFGFSASDEILLRLRIPRVLLGFFAGAILGGAGVVFQSLFRNDLASPYTLGVAGGASFGAVLSIKLGMTSAIFGFSLPALGGVIGALIATMLVVLLYRTKGNAYGPATMLLGGVVISFLFSSLVLFVQYTSSFNESYEIIRWLMGGLETIDYLGVGTLAIGALILLAMGVFKSTDLDLLSMGDELAFSRGVDASRLRLKLFVLVSSIVGITVSFVGPIGFVGIVIPHFVRILIGPAHRTLFWLSMLTAGGFLVTCDCLARVLLAPAELPVGIITALAGSPWFLYLLFRKTAVS